MTPGKCDKGETCWCAHAQAKDGRERAPYARMA